MGASTDLSDGFIFMVARQRSGTNPLRSVLESHPDVFCAPEVFHPEPSPDADYEVETNYFEFLERHTKGNIKRVLTSMDAQEELFLDWLRYLRCFSEKRFILLDVKYNSTHHMDGPWREISAEPGLFVLIKKHRMRVLHLMRRNYLRYYLSWRKANMTNQWTAYDESVVGNESWYVPPSAPIDEGDPTVNVPVDRLMYRLELCRSETEMATRSFAGYRRLLTIEYDDLFPRMDEGPAEGQLRRLTEWLEIDYDFAAPKPKFRKQAVEPLSETIENYEEVADALRGTPFEYCLEDERMYREAGSASRAS